MDRELPLGVRRLSGVERLLAGGVAARALCDDPLLHFLHGPDRLSRQRGSYEMFVPSLRDGPNQPMGALLGEHVVGVVGAVPPGHCFVGTTAPDRLKPPPGPLGPYGAPDRLERVLADWAAHHVPDVRHWHVGPVGVEPRLQGLGIGSRVLGAFCVRMDEEGEIAWLETSKPENVVFYTRAGFRVESESELHGFHTWFMRRDPH